MPFALNDLKKRDIQLTAPDCGYFTLIGFSDGDCCTCRFCRWRCCTWTPQLHRSSTRAILCSRWRGAFILHEPLKKNHLLAIGVELVGILFILNPAHLEISLRGFLEIITATLLFALTVRSASCVCAARRARDHDFNILSAVWNFFSVLLLGEIPAVGCDLQRSGAGDIRRAFRFSRALRSKRRCFCAMSASAARPSAFCSRRRSRSTPLRRRRRSFISSSPFWQRRWRSSCTTSISA